MKIDRMEKYLDKVSEGTDFSFKIDVERNGEITLYMQGFNPCGEDWCETLDVGNPTTKKDLMEKLYDEVTHVYDCFDIEENVLLMLEAKRNGFSGVPGVVDLVHNEEYKENALHEFMKKLQRVI